MRKHLYIIVADDDEDDRYFIKTAFESFTSQVKLHFAENGVALLQWLEQLHSSNEPFPSLILLDLNMPVMDGKNALGIIKKHPAFKSIPVIIFSTTANKADIANSYDAGANTFITKPSTYQSLEEMMKGIYAYWHEIATRKH